MTMTSATNLFIEVSQEDIEMALRNNSSHCAVAAAVSRQVDAIRVSVDIQTIRMTMRGTNERRIYLTPAKAQNYIIGFDAGDELKPFSFHMKKPAYVTHTRVARFEDGNRAEMVPIEATVDAHFRVSADAATTDSDNPAYVGIPVQHRSIVPRQSRQATRREYGLRMMRLNQEYGRSDTKQFGKNRRVAKPAPTDDQD